MQTPFVSRFLSKGKEMVKPLVSVSPEGYCSCWEGIVKLETGLSHTEVTIERSLSFSYLKAEIAIAASSSAVITK